MKWPWVITRSSHEAILAPWISQVSELKEERKALLDRLLTIGGIGTLYSSPLPQDSSPKSAEEAELTEQEAELAYIRSLSRTPSRQAAYMTQKAFRDARRPFNGPDIARIPDISMINEALDRAEELGKKQA